MKKRVYFGIIIAIFLFITGISVLTVIFSFRDIRKNNIAILTSELEYLGKALLPSVTPLMGRGGDERLGALVSGTAERTGNRITVIDSSGKVIADSERIAGYMDNHAGRPEVAKALEGEIGTSVRYSDSVREDMLYVALPLKLNGTVSGVLRLSMFLKNVQHLSSGMRLRVALLCSAVIALSLIGVLIFIRRVVTPVRELSETATRGAGGDFDARIFLRKGDVLKEIADSYNQMTSRFKKLLEEFSLQKEELSAILSSMQPGLIVLNRSNEIVLANRSAEGIIHKRIIPGSKYWTVLMEPRLFSLIDRVQNQKRAAHEEVELNNGIYQVSAAFVPALNETVLVFHNITEIRNLERVKKDFVLNVSHELRTPLTAIKGYAETMEVKDPENLKYLSIIMRHTDRLINIVADLLTLSELEERGLNSEREPVDLGSVADHVLKMFEGKLRGKNLTLTLDIQEKLPLISGDAMKLEQVLVNLVDNAIKYTEKGKIAVIVSQKDDRVELTVEDTGIGIPGEHLTRIFERFYTVDRSHSRKLGGTGLGLSIAKHIVQLHGGSIGVESFPGVGSTFTLRFPAVQRGDS
jgi:two-component system phosphate regulon sensor histidine kinase PhoR